METIRVRARVTGLVQGVYYRASTRERARELGVTGWVRNAMDGAVVIEAQGSEDEVAALIEWCRQGPPAARVRDVHVDPIPVEETAPARFEIRY